MAIATVGLRLWRRFAVLVVEVLCELCLKDAVHDGAGKFSEDGSGAIRLRLWTDGAHQLIQQFL